MAQDFIDAAGRLLPQEASEWDGIRAAVEQAAPLVKGGQFQLRNLYLLDASEPDRAGRHAVLLLESTGSLTVTINMNALPPGRYAVVLADAAGAPLAGQMGLILAWDAPRRRGSWRTDDAAGRLRRHDGVWYWARGRELAKADPWSAWYSYERRATCCCRWIFCRRRIWKSCARSRR